jgi:fatty acid amide hydrolase 2
VNPLLTESATALAGKIRRGEISSEEVVRAHVDHARRTHERIRAVVFDRYDDAISDARACDSKRSGLATLPPFYGVPCSIKECFSLTGMPQSSGLVSRASFRAATDAPSVARLRAAGAIPIGVTNTSELCMWMESNNQLYGRTRNPYDPTRIVGGSSGGEGAVVSIGASPFGLGSDIGGSIRMPAFFCGVFGHKPTSGVVPNEGQFPPSQSALLTTGPIARRGADLWPLMKVLGDPGKLEGDPTEVSLRDLVVLDVTGNGVLSVSDDLRAAQVEATRALERRGAKVRAFSSPLFRKSLQMWSTAMRAAGGASFGEMLGGGHGAIRPGLEFLRWAAGRSPHTLPAIGLALLEKVPAQRVEGARESMRVADRLRAEVEDAIGEHGVLLFPSYTRTAPPHNQPIRLPIQWMYTAVFNVLMLPVTQVPLGLDANGLPLGVQVVGRRGADAVTIAVARALEDAFGGWVPPQAS